MTRKASLIAAMEAGSLTADATTLEVGAVVPGYVKSVSKLGTFVGLLGDLTGLAHKSHMADAFVTDPQEFFSPGDSVQMQVRVRVRVTVQDRFSY